MASRLGSDVAFFASGAPLALAWGRGERMFRVPAPPSAPVLLALPPVGVSTPEAYALLDGAREPGGARGSIVLDGAALETWGGIGRLGGNDFETVLFRAEPRLRELFERVAQTRPLLVRMSGSGSAIIALYRSETEREAAAQTIGQSRIQLLRTATRASPAPPPSAEGHPPS
jgi:4-diphosphocytidyl-2-C-methyl-D-erythritol kinase